MEIDNIEITVSGKFFKILQFKEEWDIDVDDPADLIKKIKESSIKADIFTFMQRLPESKPKFNYYMEWDNVAAIPIINYEYWLKKQVSQNSRKKIGLAKRKGVEVIICEFNDAFIHAQLEIYNESPIRQNKPDKHYGMTFERAKNQNLTFLDRAIFLGAFHRDELIGFLKIVDAKRFYRTMGIIGKIAHRDKAPMNLLVARAVEICAQKGAPFLIYAQYDYGKLGGDTFQEFKKNLGFEYIILPRYFIPLNTWGKLMLKLNLHKRFVELLPFKLVRFLLSLRERWYKRKFDKYFEQTAKQR